MLGEIAEFSKGNGLSKDKLSENGTPCILYGELYTKYSSEIIEDVISRTDTEEDNLVLSKVNDVIIPASGETAVDISTARCILKNGILLGGDLNIIRFEDGDGRFFSYQLNGMRKYDIARIAQGVSVVHLYGDKLKTLNVSFPALKEQTKIANLLSLLDARIATQRKIIEDLEQLKKAISSLIFRDTSVPIIQLYTFMKKGKAGGTPTSTNKDYYGGDIPFLSINDITEQGKYINHTEKSLTSKGIENSSAWVVPQGSLIFSMYASVGLVTINTISLATSQAMFAMVLKDPLLTDYLYYFLTYFRHRYIYKYLETGTQSNINAEIVRTIPIPDFGVDHNIAIGKILSSIDKKISIEKEISQLLLKQKKYLLHNLFI